MVTLSICIPTYRNYDELVPCMQAIHEHTEEDYEILILDNGSEPRGAVWSANRMLRMAGGSFLALIDDDVVVEAGWWPPLRAALEADENLWACSATDPSGDNWDLNIWCSAFTRASFDHLGGLSECYIHWLADADLLQRIRDQGGRMARPEGSYARHLRKPMDDEKMIALMREWHVHDYGRAPGW